MAPKVDFNINNLNFSCFEQYLNRISRFGTSPDTVLVKAAVIAVGHQREAKHLKLNSALSFTRSWFSKPNTLISNRECEQARRGLNSDPDK